MESRGYDIIGDPHGCYHELTLLLKKLGYPIDKCCAKWPFYNGKPRQIVFVGDLVDRGPDSVRVLRLVMGLHHRNVAKVVMGNHDYKLMKWLRHYVAGSPREIPPGALGNTIKQLTVEGHLFMTQVYNWLQSLPFIFETDDLIVVHGAYVPGDDQDKVRDFALYGETKPGVKTPEGYPKRLEDWKYKYQGTKTIVVGHDPVPEPLTRTTTRGALIVNIDTGCCFNGSLTAYQYPENNFVSVKAEREYFKRKRRFGSR